MAKTSPKIQNKSQMIAHLTAGCKPKADWRIGTEHEKIGFCLKELTPLPYDGGIKSILEGLQRFDWKPVFEGENVIALQREDASVSLEPGGQLQLSGAPLEHVHQTCMEVSRHLREVREVADEIGAGFISLVSRLFPVGYSKIIEKYSSDKVILGNKT